MRSKIKAKWVIKIPDEKVKIMAEEGHKVEEGEEILRYGIGRIVSVNSHLLLGRLSKDKVDQMVSSFLDKRVEEGELLVETGGMFSKKILAPCSGIFRGIDEFYNLKFEVDEDKKDSVVSPVEAKVAEVSKEKVVLEFNAREFKGEGLVEGKVWGNNSGKVVAKLSDLGVDHDDAIALLEEVSQAIITKAEVVGVKGLVVRDSKLDEEMTTSLPTLSLAQNDWEELVELCEKIEDGKMLLNTRLGRLLVVVE